MIINIPLFSLTYGEFKNNHSQILGDYTIKVQYDPNKDPIKLYSTFSEGYAKIAFNRLKEYWDIYLRYWIVNERLPVMFEVNNQVYKSEYVCLNQSCIVGSNIPGNNRYGEFSVQNEKFDYIHSTIFFYEKDDCLVKCNQLFLNGELLFNAKQLKQKCDEIGQEFNKLDSSPYKLIEYLKQNYDLDSYTCNTYTSYNLKGSE